MRWCRSEGIGSTSSQPSASDGARAFLSELSVGRDQATLIQFNTEATVLEPLTGDIGAVDAALDRLTQTSGTRIDAALDAGRGELTGPGRRPQNNAVLILLTDGEPTGTTPEAVLAAAERAKGDGLLVFTIGLGISVDEPLLRAVASRPEWCFPSPDTGDLAAIYGQIAYAIPCRPMWP
jgi:Mg-chelatase subunit ChlD